ncbi:MAG: hypothetical protein CVU54_06060 [Deltaproteobacteria bacterium HGW-Deltaproteobacteria-12]|jgi:hypothetical protein|nr:MAG: hypothetical protein CVU54_06060 [Deltaproteobacteria bacterium HGW-Deltaproteobacteria-12]
MINHGISASGINLTVIICMDKTGRSQESYPEAAPICALPRLPVFFRFGRKYPETAGCQILARH